MKNIIDFMPQVARIGSPLVRANLSQTKVLAVFQHGSRRILLVAHSMGYVLDRDHYRYSPGFYSVASYDGVKASTVRFCTCDKARAYFQEMCT